MKINRQLILPLLTLLVFTVSCSKKDNVVEKTAATCQLSKAVYYENSVKTDSALYIYTNNKVTRINWTDWYYTFEYNGEKIAKRSLFETGGAMAYTYDQISYNADSTINKIEQFQLQATSYVRFDVIEFTYSNGKLSKTIIKADNNGSLTVKEEYAYTYTGNNATQCVYTAFDTSNGNPVSTFNFNYTYDNNANYLLKQNPQALLIEEFDGAFVPAFVSANNVIASNIQGSPITHNYGLNNNGDLESISVFNIMLASFIYTCQ